MYNSTGRYILMAIFAVAALVCVFYIQYELAAMAAFMLAFVIWSHFKHSSILLASKRFKSGDYAGAQDLLDEVPNPDRLARNRRGYYEFMRANIALQVEDYEAAEYHFQIASRFPLGGKSEKSFILIHLANLALRKKDAARMRAYIERAKELAGTPRAKDIIDKLELEVAKLEADETAANDRPSN
jgi:outer membrane PBP1 activator LpoA protein